MIEQIAMSLYQYNVSAVVRADKLYEHFDGDCAEMIDLIQSVDSKHWATVMPYPTAKVYLAQAIERYGAEAKERVEINGRTAT